MRISLALSGGGAAGLGHIPVLEAIDELGISLHAMSGTSIGALVGAAYAAGMSGRDLNAHVKKLASEPVSTAMRFIWDRPEILPEFRGSIPPLRAVEFVWPKGMPRSFEKLRIPFTAVATDYHGRKAEYFSSGSLLEPVAASIAIPGVFRPMRIGQRIYVDGGVTNNLPVDALPEEDKAIAVDAVSEPAETSREVPGPMQIMAGSMRIMMRTIRNQQIEKRPDIVLIEPASKKYGALEFQKAIEIIDSASRERDQIKALLERSLKEAS